MLYLSRNFTFKHITRLGVYDWSLLWGEIPNNLDILVASSNPRGNFWRIAFVVLQRPMVSPLTSLDIELDGRPPILSRREKLVSLVPCVIELLCV